MFKMQLLHYMKRYSELLYSWGLQTEATELCKICSKVDVMSKLDKTSKPIICLM